MERLIVTELHYHRNGCRGAGYYAGRAEWHVNDGDVFQVMFAAFDADEHIAIMGDNDVSTSFRYEDFDRDLRKFIASRGGQAMVFPHTILPPTKHSPGLAGQIARRQGPWRS
jgi:hypothetical protein